jgi:TonB family protein
MNSFIIYMVKAAVYMIAFYLIYILLLRKDTYHGRNRAFILFSLLFSAILPLINFNTPEPLNIQVFGKLLSEVFITPETSAMQTESGYPEFLRTINTVYVAGVVFFMAKLAFDFFNLLFLISRNRRSGSRIIRFNDFSTSGFSAMGYIFISARLSPGEAGDIINHEKNHLNQNHYLDILLIKFVAAFQWFNPAVHLFSKELRAIHEFQADRDCLDSGIPVVNYQSLLLSQVFRTGTLKLSNSFSNPSLVRKRMIMMTRRRSSKLSALKLLITLPVTLLVFLSVSASPLPLSPPPPPPPSEEIKTEEVPFTVADQMPMFPGGDPALLKYIAENTVYPDEAKTNNISGRVIVRFCVTASGGISQISVLKGVSPELDKEAMRVVKTLPAFEPGRQGGVSVPVWYMVPITFTLK